MPDKIKSKDSNCIMRCPACSHEMNVCRSRIRPAGDPVCPGCGATLVPTDETEKKEQGS